jgi:hypothetical protein
MDDGLRAGPSTPCEPMEHRNTSRLDTLTRIRFVAVLFGHFAVIKRVREYNATCHVVVLGVLNL